MANLIKTLVALVLRLLVKILPLSFAFWLLRLLPRRITAKLITLIDFKTDYSVNIIGLNFKLRSGPQDDHFLDLEHDRLSSWENATLKIWSDLSKTAQVCIDVGAYLGVYSIVSYLSGAKEVYAIEPNPGVFKKMLSNLATNGLHDKVTCLDFAVGEQEFDCDLLAMPNRPFSSGAHLNLGSQENVIYNSDFRRYKSVPISKVRVKPLDYILEVTSSRIDLIKIDVEGYELLVLNGAEVILREHRPVLIIEIVSEEQKEIVDNKLRSFGYGDGELILDQRERRNFVFKHKV
jgi:FkbM family methyltransferase